MMTSDEPEVPLWAQAILFWRKVLAVESRGVPAVSGRHRGSAC